MRRFSNGWKQSNLISWSLIRFRRRFLLIKKYKTIPIAVQYLKGGYGSVDMGAMMAMLTLAILPIVIFYLACQKHIVSGVMAGAVKG